MNNALKLRKLYKLTQLDIAAKIDYPKPLYAAFEHEKIMMPQNKIQELADFYKVSTEYLLNIQK